MTRLYSNELKALVTPENILEMKSVLQEQFTTVEKFHYCCTRQRDNRGKTYGPTEPVELEFTIRLNNPADAKPYYTRLASQENFIFSFVFNAVFAENSWYFRNALVRANYNDLQNNIISTDKYLVQFFENLLLGANNELKNRYLHIGYPNKVNHEIQSAKIDDSKCKNCTLEEIAILNELRNNPCITQEELAKKIGKSVRTIKNRTVEMQNKGLIKRNNGKRDGSWEVL